jgi:hypothetical protein
MFNKICIIVFILINLVFGQWKHQGKDYYFYHGLNHKKINLKYKVIGNRGNRSLMWKPSEFLRLTASTRINNNVINDILIGNIYDIASYDIRFKVYFSNRLSLTNRFFISGFNNRRYINTISIIYKF